MTTKTTAVAAPAKQERSITFMPFMGRDEISLTVAQVKSFIAGPTKSGALPDDKECVKFMMLCKARGLNPWEGDAYLIGYDSKDGPSFSLITAHQSLLKRAEAHDKYDGMESGVILKRNGEVIESEGDFIMEGDTLLGGWARVHHKDKKIPDYARVNLETFDQGFGRWRIDKGGMICKCAEADALRRAFPNSLAGMYTEAEAGSMQDVTSQVVVDDPAGVLNEKLTALKPAKQAKPKEKPKTVEKASEGGSEASKPKDDPSAASGEKDASANAQAAPGTSPDDNPVSETTKEVVEEESDPNEDRDIMVGSILAKGKKMGAVRFKQARDVLDMPKNWKEAPIEKLTELDQAMK